MFYKIKAIINWHDCLQICFLVLAILRFSTNLCDSLYLEVDYLYWQPKQDQIFYASMVPGGISDPNNVFNNQIIFVDQCFKSDSGVRARIGYVFCNDLETCIAATHFNTCCSGSVNIPNGVLATALLPAEGTLIGSSASSNWSAHYNAIDWEFGKQCDIFEKLSIRPYMGLKWAKIKQTQVVNYPLFDISNSATIPKCNIFSGIGPRFGFTSQWNFWYDVSLVGDVAFALLYGKFQGNTIINYLQNTTQTHLSTPFCRKRVRPEAEMLLGLNWKSNDRLCEDVIINIGIGYEAQYWWSQWQTINGLFQVFSSLPNSGDLIFAGLTVWGAMEF